MIKKNKILKKQLRMLTKSNTSGLYEKTDYYTKISLFENKIPSITGVITTASFIMKVKGIEMKIPDSTELATKAAVNGKATEIEG